MTRFPTFEQYIAQREPGGPAEDRTRCFGCLKPGEPITIDGYCEECMRYQFGYDEAEHGLVHAMFGGVVRAALDQDVDMGLVRRVVDEALDEYQYNRGHSDGWGDRDCGIARSDWQRAHLAEQRRKAGAA